MAYECPIKKGWHLCEEVLVEIVDPATGANVPHGSLGEVVVTRFNNVFFLLRFGTGDVSRVIDEPCPCGRTSYRLDGIAGRIGDAVKVRGLFIAPSQLRTLQRRYEHIKFQLVITRAGHEDNLTVGIETDERGTIDEEFRRDFQEICTVRIDRLKRLVPGTLRDNDPLMLDQRTWN